MKDYVKNSITNRLREAQATVIASHDFGLLKSICNTIYELKDGEIISNQKYD